MACKEILRARKVGIDSICLSVLGSKENFGGGDEEYLRSSSSQRSLLRVLILDQSDGIHLHSHDD